MIIDLFFLFLLGVSVGGFIEKLFSGDYNRGLK